MSEEAGTKKTVTKRPVARYFGAVNKDENKGVERIPVDAKKKPIAFKGDVIKVEEKAKYYAKAKWASKGKGANKNAKGRKNIHQKVDPYALHKHSSKSHRL